MPRHGDRARTLEENASHRRARNDGPGAGLDFRNEIPVEALFPIAPATLQAAPVSRTVLHVAASGMTLVAQRGGAGDGEQIVTPEGALRYFLRAELTLEFVLNASHGVR